MFYYIARETQKRLGFREMEQFASKGTRVFFCFTMEIILCLPFFKKIREVFLEINELECSFLDVLET